MREKGRRETGGGARERQPSSPPRDVRRALLLPRAAAAAFSLPLELSSSLLPPHSRHSLAAAWAAKTLAIPRLAPPRSSRREKRLLRPSARVPQQRPAAPGAAVRTP